MGEAEKAEEKAKLEAEKAKKESEEKARNVAEEKAKKDKTENEAVKVEAVPLSDRSGHVQERARIAAEKANQAAIKKAREELRKDEPSGGSLFNHTKAMNEKQAKEKDSGSLFSTLKNFFK